jgi:hypothetical protein
MLGGLTTPGLKIVQTSGADLHVGTRGCSVGNGQQSFTHLTCLSIDERTKTPSGIAQRMRQMSQAAHQMRRRTASLSQMPE